MNRLVILKIDAIGDYILFRNFLKSIRDSPKYNHWHITLIGNSLWKELFVGLDKEYIDKTIWFDSRRFTASRIYRRFFLWGVSFKKYDQLISPTFSRRFFYEDDIVKNIRAKVKVGFEGDFANKTVSQKKISDSFYSHLISVASEFEYYRNKEFVETFLDQHLPDCVPSIVLKNDNHYSVPKSIIIFPGASVKSKQWPIPNFVQLVTWLVSNYSSEIIICGSKSESHLAEEIIRNCSGNIKNMCGKTSLMEFVYLMNTVKLVVTNDTSAFHFAAALRKDVVCIFKGDYFGRFVPYPKEIEGKMITLLPDGIEKNVLSNFSLSPFDISEVSVTSVITAVQNKMNFI